MKTKLFFIALLTLITFSCKTAKQVTKTNTDVKTAVNTEVKTSDLTNKNIDATISKVEETSDKIELTDKGTSTEVTVEETTKTDFSAPDSTGIQYKKSETKSKKTTTKGESKNLVYNQNTNNKTNQETDLKDKSGYKSDSTATDKTKEKATDRSQAESDQATKSPAWFDFAVVILSAGLLGLVYLVLKRFGVVK